MRHRILKYFSVSCFPILLSISFTVSADHVSPAPDCVNGSATDSDNDGWGWENNHSCKVSSVTPAAPVCSDNEALVDMARTENGADGWGWENNKSCTYVVADYITNDVPVTPVCSDSEALVDMARTEHGADGWGWENNKSCTYVVADYVINDNPVTPVCSDNEALIDMARTDAGADGWGWENNKSCTYVVGDYVINDDPQPSDVPGPFGHDPYGIFTLAAGGIYDSEGNLLADGESTEYDIRDGHSWGGLHESESQQELTDYFVGSSQMNDPDSQDVNSTHTPLPELFAERRRIVHPGGSVQDDRAQVVSGSNPEGSFRIHCGVSHFQQVDPIINPGTKSGHLHMFWGNTETDENSHVNKAGKPYGSDISQNGQSNCQGGPYNRSAYWMPALLEKRNGVDRAVVPNNVFIYYKAKVKTQLPWDPTVGVTQIQKVNALPMGIELLGGNIKMPGDLAFEKQQPGIDWNGVLTDADWSGFSKGMVDPANSRHNIDFVNWGCYSGEGIPPKLYAYIPSSEECRTTTHHTQVWDSNIGGYRDQYSGRPAGCSDKDYTNAAGETVCKRYTYLEAQIRFPQCLAINTVTNQPIVSADDLNSVSSTAVHHSDNTVGDKVSHMYARMSYNKPEQYYCPATHPYRIPQITYRVRFTIPGSHLWEAESVQRQYGWYRNHQTLLDSKGNKADTLANYRLASDDHFMGVPTVTTEVNGEVILDPKKRGWSLHGDWLGAWNEEIATHWVNGCFDQAQTDPWQRKPKNCANGQMGNPDSSPQEFGFRHFIGTNLDKGSMKLKKDALEEELDDYDYTISIPSGGVIPMNMNMGN